jgi:hypothetical protein
MNAATISYLLRMLGFEAKAMNSFVFIKYNDSLLIYNLSGKKYKQVKFINAKYDKQKKGTILDKLTDEDGKPLSAEVGLS